MGIRRKARETAVQMLYMFDYSQQFDEAVMDSALTHFVVDAEIRQFAEKLILGIFANLEAIDQKITRASEHWSLSRMSKVDRAILRIASFEILFLEDIPMNVSINEAIEIAKRFGNEESRQFINGVVDKIAEIRRKELEAKENVAA